MKRFDVVIAGGGLIGGAIALALARAGAQVAVLDAGMPGQEASWAGAGILSAAPENPGMLPLVPLAAASLELYPEFVKQIEASTGRDVGFRQRGVMDLYFEPWPEKKREELIAGQIGLGLRAELLGGEEARKCEPALSIKIAGAIFRRGDASVDNRLLTAAVLAAALQAGVQIFEQRPALAILQKGEQATGLLTKEGPIEARWTVIAAGCFSAGISGVERFAPVVPAKGQMLAVRCPEARIQSVLMAEHVYLVPRNDGRILVGATMERVGFDRAVREQASLELLNAAMELIPALSEHEVVETWTGLRPDTPDHLPIVGATDVEGLVIATGHFRNGILLAPITGKLVCEWIQNRRMSVSCEPFSPLRFQGASKTLLA